MGIIEVQEAILEDPLFRERVETKIKDGKGAHESILEFLDEIKREFGSLGDRYLKERYLDIKDVSHRILHHIFPRRIEWQPEEPHILIAHDLTPSETAQLNKDKVLGFATDAGGRTSHTAIVARSLGIPAVVGLSNATKEIKHGDEVILDGIKGVLIVNPPEKIKRTYRKRKEEYEKLEKELLSLKELSATTIDGYEVDLSANIEMIEEIEAVKRCGAKGVGLLRTEFFFFSERRLPGEEEQFEFYKKIASSLAPDPVIIRVLDIGGDKLYSWEEYKEANPFLGWRGIRILLEEKNLLKTQLRAILRASACGNVKILLPMISSIDEVMDAKKILEETKEELRKEGKEFDEKIELGVMVEIPSCALLAREMGKFVDFFSIGSNDLTQYTLAVDRTNERISYLFSHLHPAVLKLMKLTVEGGHENGKWVGVCGEIAGDPLSVPVLLGLGVDELSTSPIIIPEIKSIIRGLTMEEARSITEKVMRMNRVEEIRRYLREEMAQRFPLLINLFVEEEDAGDNR